ncbi:cell division protein ZipA [Spongorhabdus nitratireducens]
MSLREWLLIIGVIVLIGILVDGFRRMWLARKRANELRFGLEEVKGSAETYGSELPNGGARVSRTEQAKPQPQQERRQRIEPDFSDPLGDMGGSSSEISSPRPAGNKASRDHTGNDDAQVSLSDDFSAHSFNEPAFNEQPFNDQTVKEQHTPHIDQLEFPEAKPEPEPEPVKQETDAFLKTETHTPGGIEDVSITRPLAAEPEIPAELSSDSLFADAADSRRSHAEPEPAKKSAEAKQATDPRPKPDEYFIIHVFAREERFTGEQLLQQVMSRGLRFGEMNIFHHFMEQNGRDVIEFSMANAEEPGIFNLDEMEQLETTAISFFMSLPGPDAPVKTLNRMEKTARGMAEALNGELKDENHSVFTQQTLEHYRQRIRDYERKQLTMPNLND